VISLSRRNLTVLLLIAAAAAAIWSASVVIVWAYQLDRGFYFENDRLNSIMVLTGLLAPWSCIALQFALWPQTKTFLFPNLLICLFSTLVAGVVGIGVADVIESGVDLGCEKIESANLSQFHHVCCYRLNGGATTDFGVKVCDEWGALGVKWSHTLISEYHCDGAELQFLSKNRIRVLLRSTQNAPAIERLIQL